jgi:hypothetical protein
MPISLPGAAVAVKFSFAMLLAAALADKNPLFAWLDLYPEKGGMFFAAGGAKLGFHRGVRSSEFGIRSSEFETTNHELRTINY